MIVNNKQVEAAAPSDAATQSATQFKPAVTNGFSKYVDGTSRLHVSSAGDASVSSTSTAKSIGQYPIPVSSEP
jgi:hypothetical protein